METSPKPTTADIHPMHREVTFWADLGFKVVAVLGTCFLVGYAAGSGSRKGRQ